MKKNNVLGIFSGMILVSVLVFVLMQTMPYIVMISMVSGVFSENINSKSAERIYQRDKEQMQIFIDYVLSNDFKFVYISETTGVSIEHKDIDSTGNSKVDEAIKYLNKRYYVITFSENEFVFNKWTGFSTVKGIAYSLREKPYIEFDLIEIQPLSEENWYYYVTDYERWRGNPEKYEH